jgi:hypothetical protein
MKSEALATLESKRRLHGFVRLVEWHDRFVITVRLQKQPTN